MPIYFDTKKLPELGSRVQLTRYSPRLHEDEVLQEYELVRARPHKTKQGEESAVLTWLSACTDCGDEIVFTSGLSTSAMYRRCKPCRKEFSKTREGGFTSGPRIKHKLLDPVEGWRAPELGREEDDAPHAEPKRGRNADFMPTDESEGINMKDPGVQRLLREQREAAAKIEAAKRNRVAPERKDDEIDPASLF